MDSEAQKRAKAKYKKEKVKTMLLEFYPADADIVEQLEKQPPRTKQTYIKNLIREDMNGEKQQMLKDLCDSCIESLIQNGLSPECQSCRWHQKKEQA